MVTLHQYLVRTWTGRTLFLGGPYVARGFAELMERVRPALEELLEPPPGEVPAAFRRMPPPQRSGTMRA